MNCDQNIKQEDKEISNHDFVETYNDGKTQILKCSKCGHESVGNTKKATTDVV